MRSVLFLLTVLFVTVVVHPVRAARPNEGRNKADYVLSGTVQRVFLQDTMGYRNYIVEIKVEEVESGAGLRTGDTFRAFCYQRKEGFGGLRYDTAGHNAVPAEGRRIKAYVKDGRGYHEGIYPDWFDLLPAAKDAAGNESAREPVDVRLPKPTQSAPPQMSGPARPSAPPKPGKLIVSFGRFGRCKLKLSDPSNQEKDRDTLDDSVSFDKVVPGDYKLNWQGFGDRNGNLEVKIKEGETTTVTVSPP